MPTAAVAANISFASSSNALTATVGSSLTITADRAVSWSLAPGSIGSLTPTSSTTAVYMPPQSGITAQNSIGGCLVLPNDSVFNTRIDTLPVHSESANWVGQNLSVGAARINFLPSWGVNLIDNTVPTTAATFYYQTLPNGTPFQFAPPPARKRETGSLTHDGVNDHHMISLNYQTCRFYESYQDGGGANGTSAQSGYTYSAGTYSQPASGTTDAAGLPLAPLTLHVSEIEAGAVRHALRFTACGGCIGNTFLWPATSSTGYVTGNAAAPMGSRWRLKSSFQISGYSPEAQVVLKALQQYGMILADIGSMNQIETSSDINNNPNIVNALAEISSANIIASDFDIVDESGLQVNSKSHEARPNGPAPVSDYAVITAKDANGNVLTVPVAVQPVLVGTPYTYLIFQAGQPIHLRSWVKGASNQEVTWSASVGSVSGNVYTPPSSVASPVEVTLTATAVADPVAQTQISGWIIPPGAIRIDVGNSTSYTDSKGNVWMADALGFESGAFSQQNDSYPSNAWGNLTDAQLYETYNYTWGDDIVYGPFVVPNGTYSVNFLFGRGQCNGQFNPASTWDNALVAGPVVLEANGADTVFDITTAENSTCRNAATGTISATVTNNLLTVALRSTSANNTQSAPDLNGLSIIPVNVAR